MIYYIKLSYVKHILTKILLDMREMQADIIFIIANLFNEMKVNKLITPIFHCDQRDD